MPFSLKLLFKKQILHWGVLALFFSGLAQADLKFERLNEKAGLSQNTVTAILQDSRGFMWFATQEGLNRFDGYQFTVFKRDLTNPRSISANYILSLHEDNRGRLWVGTYDGGLNLFDHETESFKHFTPQNSGLEGRRINAITQINQDELWVGTHTSGVHIFNLNTLTITGKPSLVAQATAVTDVLVTPNEDKWVATLDKGLFRVNGVTDEVTQFRAGTSSSMTIKHDTIRDLFVDSQGRLWIATDGGGVSRFEQERFTHFTESTSPNGFPSNYVRHVFEDHLGRIWFGTYQGLVRWDEINDTFIRYIHNPANPYSISHNVVYSMAQSSDGTFWVGLYSGGIAKSNFERERFNHMGIEQVDNRGLSAKSIWALAESPAGKIAIGTDGGGLNLYDPGGDTFEYIRHKASDDHSLSSDRIWSIIFESESSLWVGTYENGLNLLDLKTGKSERFIHNPDDASSLSNNLVMSMFKDSEGMLWVGTNKGLNLFDPGTRSFRRFFHDKSSPDSLAHDGILSINEDSQGNIWLGTYGGGVSVYDKLSHRFRNYAYDATDSHSLSSNIVMSILEDSQGRIWVATYGGGLNLFNPETNNFNHFTERRGLASNSLYGLLEDEQGNLWVSSNKGIAEFDTERLIFYNYYEGDGLQNNEFNSGAYLKSREGRLYFGGINGVNHFDPDDIGDKMDQHKPVFTTLRLFNEVVEVAHTQSERESEGFRLNKSIQSLDHIALGYEQSLFSFEFSSLNYAAPEQTRYSYKLENWDKHWIETDANARRATYTNIPGGDYQLLVRAKSRNQDWSDNMARIDLSIASPPWKTWWAYTAYVLIICSTIGAFLYQRLQKFREVQRSEERLSLALWGSGIEFWDWDLDKKQIYRSNQLNTLNQEGVSHFDYDSFSQRIHPDDVEQLQHEVKAHEQNRSEFIEVMYRIRSLEGAWIWVRGKAKAVARDVRGRATRIVGTIEDVDNLKKTQEELQRLNVELEHRVEQRTAKLSETVDELKATQQQLVESEKMASLGGLVAGVAHELNTPLGIALTASSQIEHEIQRLKTLKDSGKLTKAALDNTTELTLQGCELLLNNLHRTNTLVQTFKSLARTSPDEQPLEFNLFDIVEQCIQSQKKQLEDKQVVVANMSERTCVAKSYPLVIEQVLLELIDNSIRHGKAPGQQLNVIIHGHVERDELCIQYKDNGAGLSDTELSNIFEPFFTTKRGTQCTGLGMYLVYNIIVHQLKGTITCHSSQGNGVDFRIVVPVN